MANVLLERLQAGEGRWWWQQRIMQVKCDEAIDNGLTVAEGSLTYKAAVAQQAIRIARFLPHDVYLREVRKALNAPNAEIRMYAAYILFNNPSAPRELILDMERLKTDRDPRVRIWANWSLGYLSGWKGPIVQSMARMLDDPDPSVRKQIAVALNEYCGYSAKYALPKLKEHIDDSDPEVRREVRAAIANLSAQSFGP